MFSQQFQTGNLGVEIFSPNGKYPLNTVKISGKCVTKEYDRDLRGYYLSMEKDGVIIPAIKLQCPVDNRSSIGIIQPLLVFQLYAMPSKQLSLEIIVVDTLGQRRRLHFSSIFRTFDSKNQLHAQIPWAIEKSQWNSCVFNLQSLTSQCFRGATFASIDSFTLKPSCRLRKIFSLPQHQIEDQSPQIPESFEFPLGVVNNTLYHYSPHDTYGNDQSFINILNNNNIASKNKNDNKEKNLNKKKPVGFVLQGQTAPTLQRRKVLSVSPSTNEIDNPSQINLQENSLYEMRQKMKQSNNSNKLKSNNLLQEQQQHQHVSKTNMLEMSISSPKQANEEVELNKKSSKRSIACGFSINNIKDIEHDDNQEKDSISFSIFTLKILLQNTEERLELEKSNFITDYGINSLNQI
jgi:hypothetical protein